MDDFDHDGRTLDAVPVIVKGDETADRLVLDVAADRETDDLAQPLADVLGPLAPTVAVELWIHHVTDESDRQAREAGFVAHRDLWQLRCRLPAEPSTLPTRPFRSDDTDAVIAVNNRAFSWHPEQSGLTAERLAATMAEPWYDADGFRLYERDGELLGFCWTKLHHELDPVVGEIFVIAIDPSAHGQGLGGPMTRAGLDWIASRGVAEAMLYVESDNDPANATYRKIGFTHHHTDRAYRRVPDG